MFFFFLFFSLCRVACGILVPWPGIEPTPPTLEAWSLTHWNVREIPHKYSYLRYPLTSFKSCSNLIFLRRSAIITLFSAITCARHTSLPTHLLIPLLCSTCCSQHLLSNIQYNLLIYYVYYLFPLSQKYILQRQISLPLLYIDISQVPRTYVPGT